MLSSASRDPGLPVSGQRLDTTTNSQQIAAADALTPSTNTLVHYRPRTPSQPRLTPDFPTPHIRARQRRPHTIHIVSYPAGYIPSELRGLLPPDHTDPSKAPKKSKHSRKRASKDNKTPGQSAAKRKRQNCQQPQQPQPHQQPHHTLLCTSQDIGSTALITATDSPDLTATPSTRAKVLDKLRSLLSSPPTSFPLKAVKAAEQKAPLAIDQVPSSQHRVTVTTRPARPNSFLSFSRRLSATPSLVHDLSQPILESDPFPSQPLSSQPLSSQPLSSQPLSSQPLSSQPLPSQPLPSLPPPSLLPPIFPPSETQSQPGESAPVPAMAQPAQPPSDSMHSVSYPFSETARTLRRDSSMTKGSVKNKTMRRLPASIANPISSAGGMSLDIVFAEPHVFLRGFDHNRLRNRERSSGYDVAPPILRGKMRLVVARDVKIRGITIRLQNRAATIWPQTCDNSLKSDYEENEILRSQTQTVFNAIHGKWDGPYGNMCEYELKHQSEDSFSAIISRLTQGSHASSDSASISSGISSREIKGLALGKVQARSFEKGDSPLVHPTQAKGYKVFHAGTYEYNFEFPIDHHQVETIKVPHGSVRWHVEAIIERTGAFKPNLHGKKEVSIVRIPDLLSLETVDPIGLARSWEDQMFYEVYISGKTFPIGGKIPIAFKITPLAKVQVHKIKVYMTETIAYHASHKELTRKVTSNKLLMFEKAAGQLIAPRYRHSDFRFVSGGESNGVSEELRRSNSRVSNLLGNLDGGDDAYWTSTEVEMHVNIPTCKQMESDAKFMLYPDSSWRNAHVTHWIKIQMRVSRIDPEDPEGKRRRHYEISIDSPVTLLSCAANQGNMSLPQYTGRDMGTSEELQGTRCGCADSPIVRPLPPHFPSTRPPGFFETPMTPQPANPVSVASPSSSDDCIVYTPFTSDEGESGPSRTSEAAPSAPSAPSAPAASAASAAPAVPAHVQEVRARTDQEPSEPARPIHLIRVPSYAPPAFDDDNSPPIAADVVSPPPQYEAVVGSASVDGLADYFARLADYDDTHPGSGGLDESSDSDSEHMPTRIASRTGRVNVSNPRTPGGIRHGPSRSMDIQRPAAVFNLHLPTPVRRAIRE